MTSPPPAELAAVPGYFISAPWRSSGKTMLSVGLAAVACRRQYIVQTFKKGPDYIDPGWLAAASGKPCYNLDFYQQNTEEILHTYANHSASAQLTLIEGTMGLHDGLASDGSDSNAALVALLDLPVILVIDCRGMHRTVAALINGITQFHPDIRYAGVILNRIRSDRHAQKIRQAIITYTDIGILGAVPESETLHIQEQELGLTPAADQQQVEARIKALSTLVESHVDVDSLFAKTRTEDIERVCTAVHPRPERQQHTLKIGIARDAAFHFYYQDDIDYFQSAGAELIECSPCQGSFPSGLDGLWIGGGFPERRAAELSANTLFMQALHRAVIAGLPVHAECAGLMYLCRSLQTGHEIWPMTQVIDADVVMCQHPVGRGYVLLVDAADEKTELSAHEFHHSSISFDTPPEFLYHVKRGYGINGKQDGVRLYNVMASYAHFRHTQKTPWIDGFLSRVREQKNKPVRQYV